MPDLWEEGVDLGAATPLKQHTEEAVAQCFALSLKLLEINY